MEVTGGDRAGGDAKAQATTKQLEENPDGPRQKCQEPEHFSFYSQCKEQTQSVCWSVYS